MPKIKRSLAVLGAAALALPSAQVFATEKDYFANLETPFISRNGSTITIKSERPERQTVLGDLLIGAFAKQNYGFTDDSGIYEDGKTVTIFQEDCETRAVTQAEYDEQNSFTYAANEHGYFYNLPAQYSEDRQAHWYHYFCVRNDEKEFNIVYTGIDESLKESVLGAGKDIQGYVQHSIDDWAEGRPDLYAIDDLSFVNYVANGYVNTDSERVYGEDLMINYAADYHKDVAGKNISVYVDNRAGEVNAFSEISFGVGALMRDGYIYETYGAIGGEVQQVVYIPEDTDDSTEAFIDAATARINDYYAGTKLDGAFTLKAKTGIANVLKPWESADEFINIIGSDTYYELSLNGEKKCNVVILKNDDKMTKPSFYSVDLETDASIKSDSAEIPLDAQISINQLSEKESAAIAETVGIDDAEGFDIEVYSSLFKQYIKQLENGKFLVSVPVSDELAKKGDLMAYYVADDGTIERHIATVKDGFATFETTHFSTYAIGEATEAPTSDLVDINPATLDSIRAFGLLSVLGSAVFTVLIIKNRK